MSKLTTISQSQQIANAVLAKVKNKGYALESELGTLAKKSEVAKSDLAAALAKIIDDVVAESGANKTAIETLNGEAAGSVKKAIDDAFNDFATKVSDDAVVNTYKELIDYAASHGQEFTELVGDVTDIAAKLTLGTDAEEKEYATVKAYVEAYVASQIQAAALAEGAGISISGGTVSAKVDSANANGLDVTANGIKLNAATQSAAGAMSAADKTKLDGIEVATADEITAIISGLDSLD